LLGTPDTILTLIPRGVAEFSRDRQGLPNVVSSILLFMELFHAVLTITSKRFSFSEGGWHGFHMVKDLSIGTFPPDFNSSMKADSVERFDTKS
jgi:hypothetical protein